MKKSERIIYMTFILKRFENIITHPIDTLKDDFNNVENFVTHPIDTTKNFFKSEKENVTHFIDHPLGSVENELKEVGREISAIPDTIEAGFNNAETFFTTIVTDAEYAGKVVFDDTKYVLTEAEHFGEGVYNVGKKAFRIVENTVMFAERNYQIILFLGASYLGAKYVSTVRSALN